MLENGSDWEVVNGTARIKGNALALDDSGDRAVALLNARNVIQEIEFDFTLGGENAFWFYPRRDGYAEEAHPPRDGFGFRVDPGQFRG